MAEIQFLDPTQHPDWNHRIAQLPGATIFHTANWASVLIDAYDYEPLYCTALENNQITGCIPVMQINSCLTGRRGVGLPFTDLCPPLGQDPDTLDAMRQHLIRAAKDRRWKTLQIRGGQGRGTISAQSSDEPSDTFYTHTIDLTPEPQTLFTTFKSSTRRAIRKAEQHPIQVRHRTDRQAVRQFYALNCITRRAHGLPPQPLKFFKALHRHVLTQGRGFVTLAHYQGRPIAGAVYLHFNHRMTYKYGASLPQYQPLRANNLVMWHAIQKARQLDCTELHLGRTDLHHHGLRQFKQSWHPAETRLHYYTWARAACKPGSLKPKPGYPLLTRLPMPLLRLAGTLLYRHIG